VNVCVKNQKTSRVSHRAAFYFAKKAGGYFGFFHFLVKKDPTVAFPFSGGKKEYIWKL